MTDKKAQHGEYDEALRLDAPLGEAVERFLDATKEELSERASDSGSDPIPEGQLDLVPFKKHDIRRVLHNDEWWYSVIDVVEALTGSSRARTYWTDLKRQLFDKEGLTELHDDIVQLPMPGSDGKKYRTDAATTETLLRIIQSIPSPRAEPFKRWLAKVGYERIQETQDPEIAIKRAILTYQIQGRSDDWIETRIRSIVARKELTNEWRKRGVKKGPEYAKLTNLISAKTFDVGTARHKNVKGLKKHHNLRDHMTDLELILTMLGESSTKEIARQRDARGYQQNRQAAASGGAIAGGARKKIEEETGKPVVSRQNFLGAKTRQSDPEFLTKNGLKNPHYEGATPEMVGQALLRHPEPAPQPKNEDQAESEA